MDALFTFQTPTPDPPTTDAYVSIKFLGIPGEPPDGKFLALSSGPISANWKNTGANSIDTRVLGSNDKNAADADWDVVVAAAAIAAGALRHVSINPALYAYYQFQHKATVGAAQGASKLVGAHHRV